MSEPMEADGVPTPCPDCGFVAPGGAEGCEDLFHFLIARDFSDVGYFLVHRLFVDVYALQHPGRYCASSKSLAAHLLGVAWSVERGGPERLPHNALRTWVERHPALEKPPLPAERGAMTIGDVACAKDGAEHARLVREWARSTWAACAPLHEQARRWMDDAFERRRAPG